VNGCVSFWKKEIGCGLPSSRIVNSSCSRLGTSRPCESTTVVSTGTMLVPDLNVACCPDSTAAASAIATASHT
jgi:hypothetical protein